MNRQRSWAASFLPIAVWTSLASCGGGNGVGGPIPAGDALALQTMVLKEVLDRRDLYTPEDQIGVICVGWGKADPQPPPPAFISEFGGREPPVLGIGACGRAVDPRSSYPIIQAIGGYPGLLVVADAIDRAGPQTVEIRIEKTGAEGRTLQCELIMGRLEVRATAVPIAVPSPARPTRNRPVLARTVPGTAYDVKTCEWLSPGG